MFHTTGDATEPAPPGAFRRESPRLPHSARRATSLAGIALTVCLGAALAASASEAETDAPVSKKIGTEGMLLLHTGRLVKGKILKTGDNYTVQRPNGELFVPMEMVKLECKNLKDAYYQQRDQIPDDNAPGHHVNLARWCLANQLLNEARFELEEVLKVEPSRLDARDMLRRLNEVLDPPKRPPIDMTDEPTSQATRSSGYAAEDLESLGGVSRESAQQFVRRIQPIIMNNCTLAGCHTADATNTFGLQRVAMANDIRRRSAEKNLSVIMRYIDLQTPRESLLLTVAEGNHGRRGRATYPGARGSEQAAEVREWVMSVAKEAAARNKKTAIAAKAKASKARRSQPDTITQVSATREARPDDLAKSREKRAVETRPKAGPDTVGEAPDDAEEEEPDPFDPATFNRAAMSNP